MKNKKLKYEQLVGTTVKGICFKGGYGAFGYLPEMDKYVGSEGKIINYHDGGYYDAFMLQFSDGIQYGYPADLVYKQFKIENKSEEELFYDFFETLKNIN